MLTAAELRERLGWPNVDEDTNAEYKLIYLNVRPTRAGLDAIYFCLDEDRSSMVQFGFGDWHNHPDEIDEAVEIARLLISGERCVVEERDATGKCWGSGLYAPDGFPDTLRKDVASLRRVFFDREPVVEAIDFGRYFEGKHIWLSHEKKAEIDRIHREAGMPLEEGW